MDFVFTDKGEVHMSYGFVMRMGQSFRFLITRVNRYEKGLYELLFERLVQA